MRYFVYYQSDYSPYRNNANKGKVVVEMTRAFKGVLLGDDDALNALVKGLTEKVNELNKRTPRMKPYSVEWDRKDGRICIRVDRGAAAAYANVYVAILGYKPVRCTAYASNVNQMLKEGGER